MFVENVEQRVILRSSHWQFQDVANEIGHHGTTATRLADPNAPRLELTYRRRNLKRHITPAFDTALRHEIHPRHIPCRKR
jgi:hypothetical protein